MPTTGLPPLPPIAIPPQLLTLVGALIAIVLTVGIFTGIYHVAEGLRMYGSAKGRKQQREEAIDTARDGAVAAGLCFAGDVILGAIWVMVAS